MNEVVTANIDTSRATAALNSLREVMVGTGMDVTNLVRDETRRLDRTIVNFTPPIKGSGNPKQVGEKAVQRELDNLFSEASPNLIDEIGAKHGIANVNTYITSKSGEKINLQWKQIDPLGSHLEAEHNAARGPRGKVKLMGKTAKNVWSARVVVPFGVKGPYIKTVQARVGRWKASWALIGSKLGDRYPQWISRHFGSIENISTANVDGLNNREYPYTVFGSAAPGGERTRQRIQAAVNSRAKTMVQRALILIRLYKDNLHKGAKAQPAVNKTATSQEIVE